MLQKSIAYPICCLALVSACMSSKNIPKVVPRESALVHIGVDSFSLADFERSFEKNRNATDSLNQLSRQDYLELFTNMKLKVLAAKLEGYDTTEDYKDEIATYRSVISENYLTDEDLVEKYVREAYQRRKERVRAAHILIDVSRDASAEDTTKARQAAIAMLARLREGADFGEMAARFSKDPSAIKNRGDIGFFTVFQTVYPFETAAYNTPVGQLSPVIRSQFGYHIIKVLEKKPNPGNITVAQCLVKIDSTASTEEKEAAKKKINLAFDRLNAGNSWHDVVQEFSEDEETLEEDGLLPEFGTGQMSHDFENEAFALTDTGDFSKPFETGFGWHIIRLAGKAPLGTFEDEAPTLRQKVMGESRGTMIRKKMVEQLKGKFKVNENSEAVTNAISLADTSLLSGQWALRDSSAAATLFTIDTTAYSLKDFSQFVSLGQKPLPKGADPKVVMRRYYGDFFNTSMIEFARNNLEATNPEFKDLLNEIKDGVLLSQMMEKYVWEKSLTDSTAQMQLYRQNSDKYQLAERAHATIITAEDSSLISMASKRLTENPYPLELKAQDLLFEPEQTELDAGRSAIMYEIAALMNNHPEYIVEVSANRQPTEPDSAASARLRNAVNYLTDKEIEITRIIEKNNEAFAPLAEEAMNRRVSFAFLSSSKADVADALNQTQDDSIQITEEDFAKDDPRMLGAKWQAGKQWLNSGGRSTLIYIEEIMPPRRKTFEEARGSVINDLQKQLEKDWLENLKRRYPVSINQEEWRKSGG